MLIATPFRIQGTSVKQPRPSLLPHPLRATMKHSFTFKLLKLVSNLLFYVVGVEYMQQFALSSC
jgi:hypothetical protein